MKNFNRCYYLCSFSRHPFERHNRVRPISAHIFSLSERDVELLNNHLSDPIELVPLSKAERYQEEN